MDNTDFLAGLFPQSGGLLTPDQEKNARTQGLLGMAAGLLQAGGTPSPVKGGSWGRGLGTGVQGLLQGYQGAVDQSMKRQLVQGQLNEQQFKIMQQIAQFQQMGLPVPPQLQALADRIMGGGAGSGPGASPAQLAPTAPSGTPPAPGTPPAAPGTGASPPGATPGAPAVVPNGTSGTPPTGGLTPAGMASAIGRTPGSVMLDPKGTMEAYEKERLARQQADIEQAKELRTQDEKMGSALYSQATAGQQLRNLATRIQPMLQNSNMVTAPGFDIKNLVNQFKVITGHDPGAMAPTEMVRQMAAQEMLNTMREVASGYDAAGEKAPRWFQTMVEQVQKSLADPEQLSMPTMQNMLERMKREGERDYRIGGEMLKFREENGGKLGDKWRKKNLELRNNDIFNDDERKALAGLAAPPPGSGIADIRPTEAKPTFSTPTGGASMPIPTPGGAPSGGPVRVATPEEARKLPKGTPIILPDGSRGVVP